MKPFNNYTEDEQSGIVQIMRADFDCHVPKEEWVKAAKKLNPPIISSTSAVSDEIVEKVAKEAGEKVK